IERPGHEWHATCEVSKIRGRNRFVFQYDMMAPSTLEACRIPGVLDLPIPRRKKDGSNVRLASARGGGRRHCRGERAGGSRDERRCRRSFAEEILGCKIGNAEPRYPVGVLASASKRPVPVHLPGARADLLRRSRRLRGTRKNHVGAISIDGLVGLRR